MSTYGLTTAAHNRFDEAMGYLNNAERIAPEDQTVAKAQKELPRLQANWYNYLGKQSWDLAQKLYNIHFQSEVRRTAVTVQVV